MSADSKPAKVKAEREIGRPGTRRAVMEWGFVRGGKTGTAGIFLFRWGRGGVGVVSREN